MYKLVFNQMTQNTQCVNHQVGDVLYSIPFDPANVDYQQFKQDINDDTAQLEDADGNLMTAEDAKQFVSTLP